MSRICELTGKGRQVGHNVSHANNKTKRTFLPNLQNVTLISDALGRQVKLRVSTTGLRSVEHVGGLDNWLAKTSDEKLSLKARRLKREIAKKQTETRCRLSGGRPRLRPSARRTPAARSAAAPMKLSSEAMRTIVRPPSRTTLSASILSTASGARSSAISRPSMVDARAQPRRFGDRQPRRCAVEPAEAAVEDEQPAVGQQGGVGDPKARQAADSAGRRPACRAPPDRRRTARPG